MCHFADEDGGTYEEWRVTGQPEGYPPCDHTWSPPRFPDPEAAAKRFVALVRERETWTDGPHLHKHTVTVTAWEAVE